MERGGTDMMNEFLPESASDNGDTALVVAESKTFVAFDQWMDEQLDQLVARWIHTAAPNATRFDRLQKRFARQTSEE